MVESIFEGVPTVSSVLLPHAEQALFILVVIIMFIAFGRELKRFVDNLTIIDIVKEILKNYRS